MAYEKGAFVETSAGPIAPLPVGSREERVIDPRGGDARLAAAQARVAEKIGQQTINGTTGSAETAPAAETVTLSPQVAALARKEQKFRQREQAAKAKEDALAAQEAELADLRAMKTKLAAKDYSALEGTVDYNEYSQYQINKLSGTDPNQEAIKALEAKITGLEKAQEESTSKLFDAAVAERKNAAIKLLATDPALSQFKAKVEKSMPSVKLEDAVTQHILDTWENDSEELSVEQATKEVQSVLISKAKTWASLLEETPQAVESPAGTKKPLPALKTGIKTITNNVTTGDPSTAPRKSLQNMSDAERWAEARRRAEAKLQTRG